MLIGDKPLFQDVLFRIVASLFVSAIDWRLFPQNVDAIRRFGKDRENILPELKTVLPNADFAIEIYVDPREPLCDEGLFGDHTAVTVGQMADLIAFLPP